MLLANRSLCLWLPVAAACLMQGCARIDPPIGYIEVKDQQRYDFKAVSPRNNVIALKSRPNESRDADLDFWAKAVEYQKVEIDGMKLAGRERIKSGHGLDGVLFDFESGEGQTKITYLVALYVTPTRIVTVEATGPTESIANDIDGLRNSILSVR